MNGAITGKQFKLLREEYLEPRFKELSDRIENLERITTKGFESIEEKLDKSS